MILLKKEFVKLGELYNITSGGTPSRIIYIMKRAQYLG